MNDVSPAETVPPSPSTLLQGIVVLGVIATLVLLLQYDSGAYQSDFATHADEASHYVTGVMVREYIASGFEPRNPLSFARSYYDYYPKVTLGHYPPLFYLLEGFWFLLFSHQRASVLALLAALSTSLGMCLYLILRKRISFLPALGAALLCVTLPLMQRYTTIVMSDLLLCLLCLGSVSAFARYLDTGITRFSLAFGGLAALAIMTKGSGLLLALVPPVALTLSGKARWMLRPSLWTAVIPVVVICVPWILSTYHITQEGMRDQSFAEYVRQAISFYFKGFFVVFPWILSVPAILFTLWLIHRAARTRQGVESSWAVLIALPAAALIFYTVVPSGFDHRYLMPAVPAVCALAAGGAARVFGEKYLAPNPPVSTLALILGPLIPAFALSKLIPVPEKSATGFQEAAHAILRHRDETGDPAGAILISSDAAGEGAFIAEIAMQEPDPRTVVHRSSKFLASSDWMGRTYDARVDSAEELRTLLRDSAVQWIAVDGSILERNRVPHHDLLADALESPGSAFQPFAGFEVRRRSTLPSGRLRCYRRSDVKVP